MSKHESASIFELWLHYILRFIRKSREGKSKCALVKLGERKYIVHVQMYMRMCFWTTEIERGFFSLLLRILWIDVHPLKQTQLLQPHRFETSTYF